MIHVYIKPASPNRNGKVERSHLTDKQEFYQFVEYTEDVDLSKKLSEWKNYYNFDRPHSALKDKTPCEMMREKMSKFTRVS